LPSAVVEEYELEVIPLKVSIEGEMFDDGELGQEEFFERMDAAEHLPTTSQPSVGEFTDLYERLLAKCKDIVSIHLPPTVSGTIESARQAAPAFDDRVQVVDAHIWSGPLGLIAMRASEHSRAGDPSAEIVRAVERIRDGAILAFGLDGLDNLARGGRIGNATALVGGILDVRPILTIRDCVVEPVKRVRGARRSLEVGMEWFYGQVGDEARGRFVVLHAMAAERAQEIRGLVEVRYPGAEIIVSEIGAVVSTHTGSGWGIGYAPSD
jgi:DegV family protein with EDD domain